MSSWAELFADYDVPPALMDDDGRRVWIDMNRKEAEHHVVFVPYTSPDPPPVFFSASLKLLGATCHSVVELHMGTKSVGNGSIDLKKEIDKFELEDIISKLHMLRLAMDNAEDFARRTLGELLAEQHKKKMEEANRKSQQKSDVREGGSPAETGERHSGSQRRPMHPS